MEPREAIQALSNPQLVQNWRKAEPTVGFGRLDDNDYICALLAMALTKSQNGRLQLQSTFQVTEGPEEGSEIRKYDGLETEQNLAYLKGYLEVLGVQFSADDPRTIVKGCETFVQNSQNDRFKIRLRTNKDFQNVHFMGLLPPGEGNSQTTGDALGDGSLPPLDENEFQQLNQGNVPDGMDSNFAPPPEQPKAQPGRPRQQAAQPKGGAAGRPLQQSRQTTRR